MKYRILAPTGALEEGILSLRASVRQSICDFMLRMALKEILKHSKESRGVLGKEARKQESQAGRQAGKQASNQARRQARKQASKLESKQEGKQEGKQASR